MAVNSVVNKRAKFGAQAAFGTGGTLDTILNGFGFSRIKPLVRGGEMYTNMGEQFASIAVPPGKQASELTCAGKLTYNTIVYPFITMFGNVSVAADGTNGKERDFYLANGVTITKQAATIEIGDANRAQKVIDAFGRALTINLSDAAQGFEMPFFAGKRQDDTTPTTAGLTSITGKIVNPADFDVYVASTQAGLDTAETTGAAARFALPLAADITIPDISSLLYRMNSSDTSYHARPDIAAQAQLKFKCGDDDADFANFLTYLDNGTSVFFRFVALGDVIAGMTPSQERFAIDCACKLVTPEEPDEQDGAATNSFTFDLFHDPTWGKVINFNIINDVAAITWS
jgi:hypothetical protein